MAGQNVIDRAFVLVLPDLSQFTNQTQRGVRDALNGAINRATSTVNKSFTEAGKRAGGGFGRAVSPGVEEVQKTTSRVTGRVSKSFGGLTASIGRSFAGLGPVVAGAFAGVGAVTFLKDAVGAASDLSESVSKTRVIFGDAAQSVLDFSKTSATALGQTQQQALDAASTFATLGKGAGLTGPALSKFSTQFTGLATDLASFNNTSPEQAIDAIGAALRGEAEPIRAYGVLIDDASTRQEALRLGLIKTTKDALTPQQRVLAVQALIYKQTKDAQGDFARTSGGLANQQRILAAQLTNVKTTIGSALLPIVTKVVTFINTSVIPAVRGFIGQMRSGQGAGGQFAAFLTRMREAARVAFGYFQSNVLPVLRSFGGYLRDTVAPIVARLAREHLAVLGRALGTVRTAIANNRPQLQQIFNGLKAVADVLITKVIPFFATVSRTSLPVLGRGIAVAVGTIGGLVRAFNAIKEPARIAIKYIIDKFLGFVQVTLDGAAKAFGWVPKLGDKLKGAAESFRKFRDDTNAALDGIADEPVDVKVGLKYSAAIRKQTGGTGGHAPDTFATGGIFPGYSPGRDIGYVGVSGGEAIMRPEWTRAVGPGYVHAANRAARSGGVHGVRDFVGGFADGGVVLRAILPGKGRLAGLAGAVSQVVDAVGSSVAGSIARTLARGGGGAVNAGLAGVLSFVRSQVGKPYLWGGVGPGGYDCSGLISAAINTAFGRNPFRRLGATGSMPWSMFAPGPGAFSVGWFQGNPGHTAGTVNGTNIESRGGRGVVMGSAARGARSPLFDHLAHVKGFQLGGIAGDSAFDLLSPRGKAYRPSLIEQALMSYTAGLAAYANGAWRVTSDQVARVHKGEMIVPAVLAEQLRRSIVGLQRSAGASSTAVGTSLQSATPGLQAHLPPVLQGHQVQNGGLQGTVIVPVRKIPRYLTMPHSQATAKVTNVVNYTVNAPNYVGDKNDLVKTLDQLNRTGRLKFKKT